MSARTTPGGDGMTWQEGPTTIPEARTNSPRAVDLRAVRTATFVAVMLAMTYGLVFGGRWMCRERAPRQFIYISRDRSGNVRDCAIVPAEYSLGGNCSSSAGYYESDGRQVDWGTRRYSSGCSSVEEKLAEERISIDQCRWVK